ncbi:tRNA (cytidine(34)-2'-O)-methyltransferase [uncultured Campylobacter sp.]|uniref:tRNA (cytidine(34)-2'-O)-methyltransferase n=1 Tax=uncultured Campylobacter sp. TaxID=218934 RepID=UPI0026313B7D|nr:tRNA (cytidine(34)-2'-O)-methyltransferase [uncultured Campylobacter sp.]
MFKIVLVHPRIPQNVGAIGRFCVNAGFELHIVKPIVFEITQKSLRRAGLDYWKRLDPKIWENLEQFLEANLEFKEHFWFATTKGDKNYFDVKFSDGDFIFFGSESFGLPDELMNLDKNRLITIPMKKEGRSLNLAMSVGIIGYEAIRQNYKEFDL